MITIIIIIGLHHAAKIGIEIDFDIFLLCIFASFCVGLHTPRPMILGYDDHPTINNHKAGMLVLQQQQPKKIDRSGRQLLRQSMANIQIVPTTLPKHQQEKHDESSVQATTVGIINAATVHEHANTTSTILGSPMTMFPEGAELGSHLNCWSRPDPSVFQVRGPQYFHDKKKIPSASGYLFPCRGIDLFLTDSCPQNVGHTFSNVLMGGKLRDVPTLIINFRLPWGILLLYCEIPSKFVPFLDVSTKYGTDEYNITISTKLQSILNDMTPGDRTVARWCMNNSEYRNKTLKIVPVVVDGPWVVKSVVGGKPAIIGAKLPISYVYQPSTDGSTDAVYLEADLDVAASSAARGILSVARSYTQVLTLNLGFVIQANEQDELPEQMLTGARLHGIDPLTAPSLPSVEDDIATATQQLSTAPTLTDEESE
jgi:Protein ENHANCED DISEASE RESISTANCE 2, C-terminal